MEIKINKALAEVIGAKELKPFGVDFDRFRYMGSGGVGIDLAGYTPMKIMELKSLITDHTEIKGTKILLRDIDSWLAAIKNTEGAKPRTVEAFSSMLMRYLSKVPGHRVYFKDDKRNCWWAYYVEDVRYHPPQHYSGGGFAPAYCSMDIFYEEFGKRHKDTVQFHAEHCCHRPVSQSLTDKGYIGETPELRAMYMASHERFIANVDQIGKQFLARGEATDDLDGNKKQSDSWWYRRTNTIALDREDVPTRVVIDVFKEDDTEDDDSRNSRNREDTVDALFWKRLKVKSTSADDDGDYNDDDEELEATAADEADVAQLVLPVHPTLACFDLQRHMRLRIHIDQLTEYVYDPKLGEKLVLPDAQRVLIDILLAQKDGGFRDIIQGKGSGSIILSAGPPGTGKTLTAEAYAEVTARPLYTVQCSQLGTDPDDLEDNLLKTFARAARWNAILLLDEADVYVHTRGDNLTQNAIVGVFLRTLEYYKGVMFMTTNRADLVDDAIASRCVARISYAIPTVPDQKRIWRILADNAGAKISDKDIGVFATEHPELSGRDVKNLLKLAMLMSVARDVPITSKLIKEVKVFKPTVSPEV